MRSTSFGVVVLSLAAVTGYGCGSTDNAAQPPASGAADAQPVRPSDTGADTVDAGGTLTADAEAPVKLTPSILVADTNRNGAVEDEDATEVADRGTWDAAHGAVFLANLDDDLKACKYTGSVTDAQLNACNDAADEVVNGADDLLDLAEIHLTAWKNIPEGASATLSVDAKSAGKVRLFKKAGTAYEVLDLSSPFAADELRAGVELRIEGKDIIRDSDVWDGTVDLRLNFSVAGAEVAPDLLRMRMAPLVSPHHLDEPTAMFASVDGGSLSTAFLKALSAVAAAVPGKGVPAAIGLPSSGDIWTQDYWDPAYTSMPAKNGEVHALRLNYRSANFGQVWSQTSRAAFRPGGRAAYSLRGKDVGVVVAYDPNHPDEMDSENSFGNMETIPPYTNGQAQFPLGRLFRGTFSTNYPDRVFDKMLTSQKVQGPIVYVNTSWLIVGHVDEVFSFVKVNSPRGWAVVVADPTLARTTYQKLLADGQGDLAVHAGKYIYDDKDRPIAVETKVSAVLADTDLMAANQASQGYINTMVEVLKSEVGLTDSEFIHVPFFIETQDGYAVAYDPGTVNGLSFGGGHFIAPDPHGPIPSSGKDVLKVGMEDAFAPFGIKTHWVENWDLLHVNYGEVHCGSNTYRVVPANNGFWKSGK